MPDRTLPPSADSNITVAEKDASDNLDPGADDPNSPNYRYRDTGVIDGARKMNVTDAFREAVRRGQIIRWEIIDREGVEANPRQAKELITKSNLFGKVDWGTLRETGMDPGAAFLVDRVYASVGKDPSEDSPLARQDYARGIESLRERLETCKTPEEVKQTLEAMRDEARGVMLAGQEAEDYQAARAEYQRLADAYAPIRRRERELVGQLGDLMRKRDGL